MLGALGSVAIIVGGPYYLGQYMQIYPNPIFLLGAMLTGIASGMMALRCGVIYRDLSPRKALLNTALSHLLLAFIFFVVLGVPAFAPVAGGPSLSGIIAFVLLLPLSACLTTFSPLKDRVKAKVEGETSQMAEENLGFHQLPAVFWKFMTMMLLFSAIISMMRSVIIEIYPVDVTLSSSSIIMLLRIVMAAVFIVIVIHARARYLNFGKLFSLIAITIVITIAVLPTFGVLDISLNLIIGIALVVFEYVIWCVMAIITQQKQISPVIIFGFGYGSFMFGSALGWFLGVFGLTQIVNSPMVSIFYLFLAGAVLAIVLVLFSERDFERLFSPISESELTLESLMEVEDTNHQIYSTDGANQTDEVRHRGYFSQAVEGIACEKGLSSRESEVLRYLAMGRGSNFIAEQMHVSWNTARTHTHNVYVKLDVHSRKDLMDFVDQAVAQIRLEQ